MWMEIIAGIVVLGFAYLLIEIVNVLREINWRLSGVCAALERIAPKSNPFEPVETMAERYLKMQAQVQKETEQRAAQEAEQRHI
jgi:hypothetical protein